MKVLTAALALLFVTVLYSQQGDYLLTEHFPQHSNIDNSNFGMITDQNGRICVANRAGVLKYDGEAWDYYQTPSAALSLAVDSSNVIYVGCIGTVGKIDFEDRSIQFTSIIEGDSLEDLFLETHFLNGKVYFVGHKYLIVYDTETNSYQTIQGEFLNGYLLGNEVFVNTIDGLTYQVLDSLIEVSPDQHIGYTHQKGALPELVISFDGLMHAYTDSKFKKLPQNKLIEERGYELQEIQWINDSLFVCSTFESGLLFFNSNQPNSITVTDYHSGLPDNEIFSIHTDQSNGVWAAHEYGITQISPLFPAYSYSYFPGLTGNLTSVSYYQNKRWVTTSLGLFYFDQDTIYTNKVYYEVVQKKKARQQVVPKKPEETTTDKKPLLNRLFGKKKRATETQSDQKKGKGLFKAIGDLFEGNNNVDNVKGKLDKNARYVRRVKKIPVDVKYSFKKVNGASGKFLSVIPYKNKLLGIGTSGIYEIQGNEAEIIISENIRSFTITQDDRLALSTSDLEVKFFKLIRDVWVEQINQPTDDIIVSMKEDETGNLWMTGTTNIYRATSSDSTFTIARQYQLNNLYLDEVSLVEMKDKYYFINSEGYFYFDEASDQVVEDLELKSEIGIPMHHLIDSYEKGIWVYTGKTWYNVDRDGNPTQYEYLGLFPDLRAISSSKGDDRLWLLTQDNQILSYDPAKENALSQQEFFLRKVSNDNGVIDQSKKFTLSHDENFLSIELSKPDYLGLLNPEFQYKLEGLHQEWSDWSKSKTIDFTFLPEGNYKLQVRSRDAFGRIEQSEMLNFSVRPPYWQTPWFYAIQILFFGGLVIFSSRLNQDSSKNRLLSAALTLMTLVLIIEFLQSAIGSLFTFPSTPVADFLIDAMIAFMIFPLERFLREIMTKGKVNVKLKGKKLPLVKTNSSAK